jgi:hypothetical protein
MGQISNVTEENKATVAVAVARALENGEAMIRSGAWLNDEATRCACSTPLGVSGMLA